jgi:hypothetical protein
MNPRSESPLEFLQKLAGRLGRGSAVDEKAHEALALHAGTLRQIADALDTQARRALGEAAQHGDDEERLSSLVQRLEPRAETVHEGHVLEKSGSRTKPLTPPERDRVERFLEKHPNAGRPAISAYAGITDWQARRTSPSGSHKLERSLEWRGNSLARSLPLALAPRHAPPHPPRRR